MHQKFLEYIYDKGIRKKCDPVREEYLKCIEFNQTDYYLICKNYVDEFQKCIREYDNNFRNKYKNNFK